MENYCIGENLVESESVSYREIKSQIKAHTPHLNPCARISNKDHVPKS